MHDHDNNDKGMKSIMWMMLICCAVPLVLIIFLGAGGKALGAPTWVVLGGIVLMVIAHFFMMRQHKHSDSRDEKKVADRKDGPDKNHSDHGCCH